MKHVKNKVRDQIMLGVRGGVNHTIISNHTSYPMIFCEAPAEVYRRLEYLSTITLPLITPRAQIKQVLKRGKLMGVNKYARW